MIPNKNIILHDIFDIKGGGERLALSMAQGLSADLCYGKLSPKSFKLEDYHDFDKFDLDLKLEYPGIKTWALSRLFENKTEFLKKYQNVIYSGIVCPLAVNNHLSNSNYYYCHTPPRFVYDKHQHYLNQYDFISGSVLKILVSWYKRKYEESISQMDLIFANSSFVKDRIKTYLNRDSVIIYPPCNLDQFHNKPQQGFYLSTARLESLKRVDVIIKAFKKMPNKQLVICSDGAEIKNLKKLSEGIDNIKSLGSVSDIELSNALSECIATIYIPKDEDFGMSPVESMASGKPVICSDHGGPIESVLNNQTGLYLDENNLIESLCDAVGQMSSKFAESMKTNCLNRAEKFSEKRFHQRLLKFMS